MRQRRTILDRIQLDELTQIVEAQFDRRATEIRSSGGVNADAELCHIFAGKRPGSPVSTGLQQSTISERISFSGGM